MKVRVLHLITTLDPGGAEHQLLVLAREALRRGAHVSVAYLKGEGRLAAEFAAHGIAVHAVGARPHLPIDPRTIARIRKLIKSEEIEVLHTHLFKADINGAMAVGSRHRRARVRSVALVSSKHNQDQHLKTPGIRWLARRALARADRVIAISEAVALFLEKHATPDAERLDVIHYGFDVAAFDARVESSTLRRDLGIDHDAPLAIYVGRLVRQKGLDTLLDAAAIVKRELPNAMIVIVGAGPLEAELSRRARELALGGTVAFAGFRADIKAVIGSGNLLVLPSRWEGFGMVLAEAMAARRAVVASRAGSIPEVVEDGVTGLLFDSGDAAALAASLLRLLRDPELAREFGTAGRHRLLARFGVERMIAGIESAYVRALARADLETRRVATRMES